MASSASKPGAQPSAIPKAANTSSSISTCGVSVSGTCSTEALAARPGVPAPRAAAGEAGSSTRCALYDGSRLTRNSGRQSASKHAISRSGRWCVRRCEMKSRVPRTAFTGRPSGAVIDSGSA